jgi:hypothetical protein
MESATLRLVVGALAVLTTLTQTLHSRLYLLIFSMILPKVTKSTHYVLRMNWSNIEKWRKLLKIGTIVLLSMLKYCAKFKKFDRGILKLFTF